MTDETTSGASATETTQNTTTETTTTDQSGITTDTGVVVKPDWPSEWRTLLAGEDQKTLDRLGRFNSVKDVWASYTNMEKILSSGQHKATLPSDRDPTAEELTAYRKASGIPENAADYAKALPAELVIGEEDKAAVDLLMNRMHKLNASPALVKEAVQTYYDALEHAQEQAVAAQQAIKQQSEDTLRKEWGAEYRSNMNAIKNMLAGAPEGVQDLLSTAVLSDGSLAFNNADFMRWFAGLTREINPASTVVPAGHGDPMTSVVSQLSEYKARMQKDINAWQHPSNSADRARYLDLLRAQEKLSARR